MSLASANLSTFPQDLLRRVALVKSSRGGFLRMAAWMDATVARFLGGAIQAVTASEASKVAKGISCSKSSKASASGSRIVDCSNTNEASGEE